MLRRPSCLLRIHPGAVQLLVVVHFDLDAHRAPWYNEGMIPDSDKPNEKRPAQDQPPDGRGERPTDPNELAKWIVDQTTDEEEGSASDT